MSKSIVLLSGGIDSSVMLAEEAQQPGVECYALTVDYHQRSEHAEINAAKTISQMVGVNEHRVVELDLRSMVESSLTGDRPVRTVRTLAELREFPHSPEMVPARNTIFLSLALGWAETVKAERVLIGCTAEDSPLFPDCTPRFIDAFEQVARTGTIVKPAIVAPLIDVRKHQIIERAVESGMRHLLPETVSCYQVKWNRHCGRCAACQHRIEAFDKAGVVDTTEYKDPI